MRYLFLCLLVLGLFQSCKQENHDENLIWYDEFNEDSKVLSEKWNVIIGNGCPEFCGFGNNELQYYTNSKQNLKVEDGKLVITAIMHKGDSGFTSAKLSSQNKGDWQYGYFEIRAKLPTGTGTWPAFWMLPSQEKRLEWPLDGEIDIMEHVGYNPGTIYGTVHTKTYNNNRGNQKSDSILIADATSKYHIYAIDWQEHSISWFVDNEVYHTIDRNKDDYEAWPFSKPFHLIINLAIGGNWGGEHGVDHLIFPQAMMVDYVRVFKEKPVKK
jgi:beta-glucanase (GH16 family)